MLGVVADVDAVADLDRARVVRQLAGDHAQQRGLAGAVDADDADLLAALDGQIDAGEHDVIAVRLLQLLDPHRLGDRARARRQREAHRAALLIELDVLHLLEHLDARLHGLRLVRLRAEPVDEAGQALALARQVLRAAGEDRLLLGARGDVLIVVARVAAHALELEADDARNLLVQEVAIVGDQDEAAAPLLEELAEPRDRRHVEVVGRLVEQQHVGALEQEACEHAAHLPAAGELLEVAVLVTGRKAEAGEDRERFVLAEEAIEVIDAIVQLADLAGELEQLVLIEVVLRRLLERRLDLREPLVELLAAGHARQDHVDQRAAAGDREILRQPADAHPVRARHRAVVDLLLARDDLQQRRLARPVRADQTDPVVVAEAQAHVVEDHAISEEQRDAIEDDEAHEPRMLSIAGRGRASAVSRRGALRRTRRRPCRSASCPRALRTGARSRRSAGRTWSRSACERDAGDRGAPAATAPTRC